MLRSKPTRKKRRGFSRMSVFATLLISYLTVLMIPVSIATGLYGRIENIMMDNADSANRALIEQVKQVVDSRLEELAQLSRNMVTHPQLGNLLRYEAPLSGTQSYDFIRFKEDMERYRNISTFVNDFYIYFRESDSVLTPLMKTSSALFYSDIYNYAHMSYEQWMDVLHQVNASTFLPAAKMGKGKGQAVENMLTYVQSLPIGERHEPSGALVILINEQQIQSLMDEIIKVNKGAIFIKDRNGQILLRTGDLSEYELEEMSGDEGVMTVSSISSASGWEYISVVPAEVFWDKVNTVKQWAISMLVLCLVAGVFACSLMSYRSYRPIKEIIQSIGSRRKDGQQQYIDEYDYIKDSFKQSFDKQMELEEQLVRQTPVIQANFLSRLLKGAVDWTRLTPDTLDFMGISFPHTCFAVVIIKLDDASGFIRYDRESEWALIRFVVGKVAEEMPAYTAYSVELEKDKVAIILNLPPNYSKEAYYAWSEQVQRIIRDRFRTLTTFAVSEVHEELDSVVLCLSESQKALDYAIFNNYNSILYYEELKDTAEGVNYYFPLEAEGQLINATKSGDYAKAAEVIRQLYDNNFSSRQMTPELGKLLFSNLLSTLFKLLNALGLKYEDVFDSTRMPLGGMNEAGSVEELYQEVLSMFELVCSQVQAQKEEPGVLILGKMKAYIDESYANPMLSLVSIAEQFQITPQYLSAFFKKHSGMNITDYIAQVRLAQAKQLLAGTGYTISRVAAEVGYSSDIGFIRMFKKYEGITPGKYKEMNKA